MREQCGDLGSACEGQSVISLKTLKLKSKKLKGRRDRRHFAEETRRPPPRSSLPLEPWLTVALSNLVPVMIPGEFNTILPVPAGCPICARLSSSDFVPLSFGLVLCSFSRLITALLPTKLYMIFSIA